MDFYDAWNASLEEIKRQVTGVGVWTALNTVIPITLEDGLFVLGMSPKEPELRGHLNTLGTKRVMERELSSRLDEKVRVEVIDGITINDWEALKRRRAETEKLKKQAIERDKKVVAASAGWDKAYEQIGREYGDAPNKAMPQTRAVLLDKCVEICAQTLAAREMNDSDQRNLSRCCERIGTYCEVPSTLVAMMILERTGRL